MLDGYTYWKDGRNKNAILWYCSKRYKGCHAFIKMDHNHKDFLDSSLIHTHRPADYRKDIFGNYMKV